MRKFFNIIFTLVFFLFFGFNSIAAEKTVNAVVHVKNTSIQKNNIPFYPESEVEGCEGNKKVEKDW